MKTFTFKTLRNKYGSLIQGYLGLDKQALEEDYEKDKELRSYSSVKDYMWSLFNRMLMSSAANVTEDSLAKFYRDQSSIYFSMSVFGAIYDGKDGKQYNRLQHKAEIESERIQSPIVLDIVVIPDEECSHAMKFKDVKIPIEDELSNFPLANENCERLWCRCGIGYEGRRDENGNLMMRKKS